MSGKRSGSQGDPSVDERDATRRKLTPPVDDATYDRWVEAVFDTCDEEPSSFSPTALAFFLATIVSTSKGRLNPKYKENPAAKALLQQNPELMEKLTVAWKDRTLREISNLPVLQAPSNPTDSTSSGLPLRHSTPLEHDLAHSVAEFHIRPTTPENKTDPLGSDTFQHTPAKSPQEFDAMINEFLNKRRPRMRELVENAKHVPSLLPSWKPDPSTNELAKHISGLSIPTDSGGEPSLLLHDLGEEKDDLDGDRIARIPDIFSFAHHTVLINTSGSGKTRLLLEGLCRRWGFYFVAKPDVAGTGSSDLWWIMDDLDNAWDVKRAKASKEADPKAKVAIEHIREAAERRLAQLLLARFLLLDLLVQEARRILGGLQEKEHRRLWVLLQVQPQIFGEDSVYDIFTTLTRLLQHASIHDLKSRIRKQYGQLSSLLQNIYNPATDQMQRPPFFCILDEAQITTTLRHGDFMSSNYSSKRPVLREIWLLWSTVLDPWQMRLVLSGTGIELQDLKDTLASSVLKRAPYAIKSDIGAFEKPRSQAEYIKRYVPAHWTDQHWKEFLIRAWGWLRGRYRSTATLISLILQAGYPCPHRTIDEYVKVFTDFVPTDGKDWTDRESQLPPDFNLKSQVSKLNFEKMNDMQASTLANAVYDQILYGHYSLSSFGCQDRATFVEYGFARHKPGTSDAVLDEPLATLAALQWLNQNAKLSLFECLRRDIERHSKRKNGFEAYLAFHLRKVFETAPELDAVFTFRDDFARRGSTDIPWQHEQFELVTVVATEDTNNPRVSVVTPSCGSSSNIGFLAHTGEEVLEWISINKDQFTFCFPQESFGPDVLFFARSKVSGRLLLVVVQAKKYNNVKKYVLVHGVRTVTPSWFWKSKDAKYPTADTAPFIKIDGIDCPKLATQTKAVLADIPLGLKAEDADYPVLRVFASWQGEAKLERTLEWSEQEPAKGKKKSTGKKTRKQATSEDDVEDVFDHDRHPLATLHLANFREVGMQLDQNWFRGDVEQKLVVHSKRTYEERDFESSRVRKSARLAELLFTKD